MAKKAKAPSKRISAALSRWLKKQNPGAMKGVTHVRVKRLKGGGVSITPAGAGRVKRRRNAVGGGWALKQYGQVIAVYRTKDDALRAKSSTFRGRGTRAYPITVVRVKT